MQETLMLECIQPPFSVVSFHFYVDSTQHSGYQHTEHGHSQAFSGAGHQWFKPIILGIWEDEIRRMAVRDQPGQTVPETPVSKITRTK
jgi:hypothetical protein